MYLVATGERTKLLRQPCGIINTFILNSIPLNPARTRPALAGPSQSGFKQMGIPRGKRSSAFWIAFFPGSGRKGVGIAPMLSMKRERCTPDPHHVPRENSFPQATPLLIDVFFAPSGNKQGVEIPAVCFVIWIRKYLYHTVGAQNINGKLQMGPLKTQHEKRHSIDCPVYCYCVIAPAIEPYSGITCLLFTCPSLAFRTHHDFTKRPHTTHAYRGQDLVISVWAYQCAALWHHCLATIATFNQRTNSELEL